MTWQTGYQEDGSYLLPGGRKLERAGVGVLLGGFPSEILAHPTLPIAYALIAGRNERHIAVVDLETQTEIQRLSPTGTFTGMALHPNASNLVVAGGGGRAVDRFTIGADGLLTPGESLSVEGFPSGIAFSPNGDILWVGLLGGETLKPIAGLLEIDVENWSVSREMDMDALIWDLAYLPDSGTLFATDIEGSSLHIIDVDLWEQVGTVEIPTSPTGIAVDPIQGRIWVAASGADAIATIDPTSELVTQWTPVTDLAWVDEDGEPLPNSNVNSLHYDPMRDWLFATRGADNAVSIFDASTMELIGQLPTAWYPTASTYISETNTLLIAEGKASGRDRTMKLSQLRNWRRDFGTVPCRLWPWMRWISPKPV